MKKWLTFPVLAFILHTSLFAEKLEGECCAYTPFLPPTWEFSSRANILSEASFDSPGHLGQELRYTEAAVEATFTYTIDGCKGVALSTGVHCSDIDWRQNPHFRDKSFYDVNLTLSAYSYHWDLWYWRAGFQANVDTEKMQFANYAKYQGLIWGRYAYSDCLGLHIGAFGGTGLHDDYVHPILGFDYSPFCNWHFNVIIPVNASASYQLSQYVDLEITLRHFKTRHRVSEVEVLSRGIFEYEAYGVDFGPCIHLGENLSARLHAGSSGGGQLRVFTSSGNDLATYKLDGALYAGGELSLTF